MDGDEASRKHGRPGEPAPGRAFALTGTLSDAVVEVPAPGSLPMFGFALLGLGLSRRKRT